MRGCIMLCSPLTGLNSVGLELCGVLAHSAWFARYPVVPCNTLLYLGMFVKRLAGLIEAFPGIFGQTRICIPILFSNDNCLFLNSAALGFSWLYENENNNGCTLLFIRTIRSSRLRFISGECAIWRDDAFTNDTTHQRRRGKHE